VVVALAQGDCITTAEVDGRQCAAHFPTRITDSVVPFASPEEIPIPITPADGLVIGTDGTGGIVFTGGDVLDGLADVYRRQPGSDGAGC